MAGKRHVPPLSRHGRSVRNDGYAPVVQWMTQPPLDDSMRFLPALFLVPAFALSACDSNGSDGDTGLCADRTGGALITFRVVDETFTGWFTDETFIQAAETHRSESTSQVPVFGEVLTGQGCDEQWSFHVAADDVHFADQTIELCDGRPSYIDANLDDWIDQVGQWCPWGAEVVEVDRQ